jgi:transcription initiation factor TFIIIB Brf1 subunit/transcription initiation factor TFIIB
MTLTNCPHCNDTDIEISFNHKLKRHTLTCFNCNTYTKIIPKQGDIKCPECESKDIRFEEDETVCGECGLQLSGVPPIYVNGRKIVYDWGLKL